MTKGGYVVKIILSPALRLQADLIMAHSFVVSDVNPSGPDSTKPGKVVY